MTYHVLNFLHYNEELLNVLQIVLSNIFIKKSLTAIIFSRNVIIIEHYSISLCHYDLSYDVTTNKIPSKNTDRPFVVTMKINCRISDQLKIK